MSWRPLSRTLAMAVGIALLPMSACVQPKEPGVGIANLGADLVFGAKDPLEAAPANAAPAATVPADEVLDLPPQFVSPNAFRKNVPNVGFRAGPAADPCPAAALNAFPEESAPENVPADGSRLPQEGLYRWQRQGFRTVEATQVSIDGFETRAVRNVEVLLQQAERIQYTFETVQTDGATNEVVITYWFVDTRSPNTTTVFSPVDDTQATAGRPERGLVIKKIERYDREGNLKTSFEPGTGLLIAPLPVTPGQQWTSVAIDPRNRNTLRYEAQIIRRRQIDACGTMLDGWFIEGQMSTPTGEYRYGHVFAPQFGALLLHEHLVRDGGGAPFDLSFTTGQKDPSPVEQQ